jgi:hypothetical protein
MICLVEEIQRFRVVEGRILAPGSSGAEGVS